MNVNTKLDLLAPDEAWLPDVDRALVRFHAQRFHAQRALSLTVTRRALLAAAAVAMCVCLAGLIEFRAVSAADRVLKDRQAAPDFSLNDSSGAVIRLSSYKGKVVLLNFWATWCGGCKMEIDSFVEFENKYKGRGFTVIGVSMDEDGFKSVLPFAQGKKMNYPVVIGNEQLARKYGVQSMPETLLIDGSGRIAAFHLGLVDQKSLEREIRTLLD